MNSVEIVKQMCKDRGITIAKLERDCDFSNGYIGKLKNGVFKTDKLQRIADYFGVPMEDLLGIAHVDGHRNDYYLDKETATIAQEIFNNPNMRALFDAARDSRQEDLVRAADLLLRFKETNPDG